VGTRRAHYARDSGLQSGPPVDVKIAPRAAALPGDRRDLKLLHPTTAALAICLSLATVQAYAYSQDKELELALRRGDPSALAQFPAKGHKDGLAGFFRHNHLYVIPDTERAWCQEQVQGVLAPGCYVEFRFQMKGRKASAADLPCGLLVRWYRVSKVTTYRPTPGALYANAIANGDWEAVMLALSLDEAPPPVDFSDARWRECASSDDR